MKKTALLLLAALGVVILGGCASESARKNVAQRSSRYTFSATNSPLVKEEPFIWQMNPPVEP